MSETSEQIYVGQQNFEKAFEYFKPDRLRFVENIRMNSGVDYAQWPKEVVEQLLGEGRQVPTFNIATNKLYGLAGSLLRNIFDIKYEPMDTQINSLTLRMQDLWVSDRETMNFDVSYLAFLIDFLTQYGIERMVVREVDNLPHIGFERLYPLIVTLDPAWKSISNGDMQRLWVTPYLTISQMAGIYPNKIPELKEELMRQKLDRTMEYEKNESPTPYKNLEDKWGSEHRVIEYHEMREEIRDVEYDLLNKRFFPDTGFDLGSKEDISAKRGYVLQNGLDATTDITYLKQKKLTYWVQASAPTLSKEILLENRPSVLQVGRLPYFVGFIAKFGTQMRGIMDLLRSPQQNINKYMTMMMETLDKSARDAFFLDPNIVNNDETKMGRVEKDWNRAGARVWTAPGALETGGQKILAFPSSHVPNDLMSFNNILMELSDRLSHQVPASEGRQEASGETGVLFRNKFEASVIARGVIDQMLKLHWINKADAYLRQAKLTYSGVERSFAGAPGKSAFKINERVMLLDGTPAIRNDISSLPRHRVVITYSRASLDVKTGVREVLAAMRNRTVDPLAGAVLDKLIAQSLELPEADAKEIEMAYQLAALEAALNKVLNIKSAGAQIKQVEAMIAQTVGTFGPQGAPEESVPEQVSVREPSMEEAASGTGLLDKQMLVS